MDRTPTSKKPDFISNTQFFKQVIESLEDYAVFTTDHKGTVTSWNQGAENILGYTEKEIIGKSSFVFFTPGDRRNKIPQKEIQNALNTGSSRDERYHLRKDKSRFWASGKLFLLKDEDGKVYGFTKIMRDLTASKEMENKVNKAYEDTNNILESISDAFVSFDREWKYRYINKKAAEIIKKTKEEVLGKSVFDVFPNIEKNEVFQLSYKAWKEKKHIKNEYFSQAMQRWLEANFYPSADGGLSAYYSDISKRKDIEKNLQIQAQVLESMTEGVSLSNSKGIIKYTNPAEDRIFGYNRGELIGKHHFIQNIYSRRKNNLIMGEIDRQIEKKGYWTGEFENVKKDGTIFTTFARISKVEIDGEMHWVCLQEDITKRKQSEQKLRESEERLRLALEAGNMGAWDWDIANNKISWTDKVYELHGTKKGEFDGSIEEFNKLIHPDDSNKMFQLINGAVEEVKPFKAEFRVRHRDGKVVWLFTEALTLADAKGKAVRMLGVTFEITERKNREINTRFLSKASKVIYSSLDYQTTLNNLASLAVPDIADWCSVDMLDENGGVELVAVAHKDPEKVKWAIELRKTNPVDMEDLTGLPNVIRTGQSEMYPLVTDEMIKLAAKNAKQLRLLLSIGFRSVMIVPIKSYDKVIGVITFVTTQTGRQYTNSDLQMAEELASRISLAIENAKLYQQVEQERTKFKILYDSNIIGVMIIDKNNRITQANENFLKLLGYTNEEIESKSLHWNQITPHEYLEIDEKAYRGLKKTGDAVTWEKEFIKSNEENVPVIVGCALINKRTQEKVAFVLDITEQKKLEERKDEFIGIASHELKTPLTSIKGYVQILEKALRDTNNEKVKTLFNKTNIYINKLDELIIDLLDVSKIQAGKLQFDMMDFNLKQLIDDGIGYIQAGTSHKIILEGDSNINIFGDKHRLEQVFVNLLSNAVKYSPDADKIKVKITRFKDNVEISVQDFGIGISKKHYDKLFQRFYRVEKSAKNFSGLGIGLYISSKIISRHGGRIWVESELGKGSTFYFNLPIKKTDKK